MSIKKIVLDNGHVLEVEHDDNFLNIDRFLNCSSV